MSELISVIVPVYNVEAYLEQCLDSILSQTYTNLEILLINDGSTDRSGEICDAYAVKDSRVKVFHQTNAGVSAARNAGLALAQGTYVTFVDSDDWVDMHYVSTLYKYAVEENADLAMARYCRFNQESGSYSIFYVTHQIEQLDTATYLERLFLAMSDLYVVTWGKLYHRQLFEGNVQIRFPEGILTEDQYVSYLLALASQKMILVDETLYCYRKRDGSASNQFLSLKHIEDDLAGHSQRLVDVALAGYPIGQAVTFLKERLSAYRQNLEETNRTDTEIYRSILRQLELAKGEVDDK